MFCFSMKITHPKVFIFRNWESFGNICIRSQSLLLAKAGEVVWVATFELQLNRDFKQRQNRPMQHHKSRWSIPSVVLQFFFSENLSSHLKKKIPRESRSIPVTLSKVAFFEAFPLCVGTFRYLERINYFFSFQCHVMWISPIILMWNLWRV